MMVEDKSGHLTVDKLEFIINELCGSISNCDKESIIEKTFAVFNVRNREPITENHFVNVIFIYYILIINNFFGLDSFVYI